MIIVGAGLAGLIAGHVFPNATIVERSPRPPDLQGAHRALLRFRSDAVSLVTGIPFRKVRVHKAIWSDGAFRGVTPALANQYSRKVIGKYADRSVWDLEPVDRWIAPEDFYAQCVEACARRIMWDTDVNSVTAIDGTTDVIVSTIPLHLAVAEWLDESDLRGVAFERAPIRVRRFRVRDSDVYQTVYFPDPETSMYRASITGSLLIMESVLGDFEAYGDLHPVGFLADVFGLRREDLEPLDDVQQSYGKIAPIDNALRRELIRRLTDDAGVYSVGRFATWRNILLDDVVKDLRIVKELINGGDSYARRLAER